MLSEAQRVAVAAQLRRGRSGGADSIPRRPGDIASLPLSYGQEQLWFIDRFAPGLATYNIPLAVRLTGELDAAALGRAVDGLRARHEALRTRLVADADGRPVQVIDPPTSVPLVCTDLSGLDTDRRETRLREVIEAEAARPFVLADGPLLRTLLLRLTDREHVLLVVVHHTVFDGWSATVLIREVAAFYAHEVTGEPTGLAQLPVQFADYALWERNRLQSDTLTELTDYWRETLCGFETLQVPTDRPRPALDNFDGGLVQRMTGGGLLEALRELSRREGTTLFVTLMAAVQALLSRYTGQTDVVVGTVSANRGRGELTPLIGFLVNTLPIRTDLSGDPTFHELLSRVKQNTIGAYAHQDLPFAKLVEVLRVERDPSRAPIFQTALVYAERDDTPVTAAGVDLAHSDLIVGVNAAKFDLTLLAEARGESLWFEASYKTALFDRATIERFLAHLEHLLRGAVADPSRRVSELPVLSEAERHRELVEWNRTAGPVPTTCIHQEFERQVRQTPGAVAAEFDGRSVTYARLNARANQVARRLRGLGVAAEDLVGVCMSAGTERLAALLGVFKVGGAYVPLDAGLPAERLAYLIADTGMPVVLADTAGAAKLPAGTTSVVCLGDDSGQFDGLATDDLGDVGVTGTNAAYVIYTSGSTGTPKGVVVEHRNAVNLLLGMARQLDIGADDVVLQFASLSFDVSVMDMFMPLLGGARVVLAPPEVLHSPPGLAALMRERHVTFACLPPAMLALLVDEDFPDLRALMAAGEALPSELAEHWIRPGLRFYNGYGPTEATVIAAYAQLDGTVSPPPIGLPTRPNYRLYVLDARLNPVPVGVVGELHIGGVGVARGYLNRPELTGQRFIEDPFVSGGRLYKTGDLVRRRADGTIVFVGRADTQVKIRGLRVELGEIEAVLGAHPDVAQAVVTVHVDGTGDQQLVGYVRGAPGRPVPDEAQVRGHAADKLPGYMVPNHVITLDTFPVNASGKIDKAALPAPDRPASTGQVAPATLIELLLVDLYADLLDVEQVGATDSFFDLGGNSLQAMRLVSKVDNELGVDIGATAVFRAPSPRQLTALLCTEHELQDSELDADAIDDLDELSEVG